MMASEAYRQTLLEHLNLLAPSCLGLLGYEYSLIWAKYAINTCASNTLWALTRCSYNKQIGLCKCTVSSLKLLFTFSLWRNLRFSIKSRITWLLYQHMRVGQMEEIMINLILILLYYIYIIYFETYLIFVLKIIQKIFSIFGHQQQTTTGTVPSNCQIYVTCPYR